MIFSVKEFSVKEFTSFKKNKVNFDEIFSATTGVKADVDFLPPDASWEHPTSNNQHRTVPPDVP